MLQRVPGLSTFVLLNTVLLYGLIPFHLPTHPPVDMFLLGAITNNALETPMCKFLHKPMFPFLKIIPRSKMAGSCGKPIGETFWESSRLFSKAAFHISIGTVLHSHQQYKRVWLLHILTNPCYYLSFYHDHLSGYRTGSPCGLALRFPEGERCRAGFLCLWAICTYSFRKCLFRCVTIF